jgi:hypothetical protein
MLATSTMGTKAGALAGALLTVPPLPRAAK